MIGKEIEKMANLTDIKAKVDSAWGNSEAMRMSAKEGAKKHPDDEKRLMWKEHLDRLTYHLGWASLFLREMIDETMKTEFENGGCN